MTETPEREAGAVSEISFGKAGTLYLGTDAELLQGCSAIMATYDKFFRKKGPADPAEYRASCISIEARAEIIAPISAKSTAGIQAKARVVERLSRIGMAGYAIRILATSLAKDVLASEGRV